MRGVPNKYLPYKRYLRSKWWKARRLKKLRSVGGKCEQCGRPAAYVVHRTWATKGRELDADLEALCPECFDPAFAPFSDTDWQNARHLDAIAKVGGNL
jgi:hypothetical protein